MFCTRCNKTSDDAERCAKCGTRLKTLASQQRRGWVAFFAGVFLIVLALGIWIWVDRLLTGPSAIQSPALPQFIGKLNVTFAMLLIAGVLGAVNGWMMIRTGRRNLALILLMLAFFVGSLFLAAGASSGFAAP